MEFGYSNIILGNNTEFLIAQKSHIFYVDLYIPFKGNLTGFWNFEIP